MEIYVGKVNERKENISLVEHWKNKALQVGKNNLFASYFNEERLFELVEDACWQSFEEFKESIIDTELTPFAIRDLVHTSTTLQDLITFFDNELETYYKSNREKIIRKAMSLYRIEKSSEKGKKGNGKK